MAYTININGRARSVDAEGEMPLLWALRDILKLSGTKFGCGTGLCGACTVHLDGKPVRSCQTSVADIGKAKIATIEGVGATQVGRRLQDAWVTLDVPQCGYCQAGQIMAAAALLRDTPKPNDADIDAAMSGNACRCATYSRIRTAIKQAAGVDV